jgi:hypothetical protein
MLSRSSSSSDGEILPPNKFKQRSAEAGQVNASGAGNNNSVFGQDVRPRTKAYQLHSRPLVEKAIWYQKAMCYRNLTYFAALIRWFDYQITVSLPWTISCLFIGWLADGLLSYPENDFPTRITWN